MGDALEAAALDWPAAIFTELKAAGVAQISYVPDAGHARLIRMAHDDPAMKTIVLTTEEEGIAIAGGAWLGGEKSAVLLQSSGVGNCINMLSLAQSCRFPLLMLVTMRGEWAEFNPWQVPMGQATQTVLEAMGMTVFRLEKPEDTAEMISNAASLAFTGEQQIAVLIAQRMIGRKKWVSK